MMTSILKFSTQSSISFLSRIASLQLNMKLARKAVCSNFKFTSLIKNFSMANAHSAFVKVMIIIDII